MWGYLDVLILILMEYSLRLQVQTLLKLLYMKS